jgi:hypothetical protein
MAEIIKFVYVIILFLFAMKVGSGNGNGYGKIIIHTFQISFYFFFYFVHNLLWCFSKIILLLLLQQIMNVKPMPIVHHIHALIFLLSALITNARL